MVKRENGEGEVVRRVEDSPGWTDVSGRTPREGLGSVRGVVLSKRGTDE